MPITDKREQRLMTASPEALAMERSSIHRFADKLEIDQTIGLLDAGGVQMERELLEWRIDTFNQALDRRPDLKMEAIDAFSVYTDAARKALDRRQAAEESYREQSPGLAAENKPADDGIKIVPRENGKGLERERSAGEALAGDWKQDLYIEIDRHLPHRSSSELPSKEEFDVAVRKAEAHFAGWGEAARLREYSPEIYRQILSDARWNAERFEQDEIVPGVEREDRVLRKNGWDQSPATRFEAEFPTLAAEFAALPRQSPEEKAARFKDAFDHMERIDRDIRRDALVVDLFANQENNIREEWLADLQTGRRDRHALDSYFAGRVDQHNTLIGMAVEAHPHLRETLPPPIQYGEVREQLQQLAQRQAERNSHAVEEPFRFAV